MIDHSDSTNGKSPKHYQDKLKADPDSCPECDETWKALEEMKADYEKALELSGQNNLELQCELQQSQLENHQLRAKLQKYEALTISLPDERKN